MSFYGKQDENSYFSNQKFFTPLFVKFQKNWEVGIHFFRWGGWGSFFKVILMSFIEAQDIFPMINFDVSDRLGHVLTIFKTVGLRGSIFHCHICEILVSKWADFSVCNAFISKLLIKALQKLRSAHFDTKILQIWQWKIDPHSPTVLKWLKHAPIGPKHQN